MEPLREIIFEIPEKLVHIMILPTGLRIDWIGVKVHVVGTVLNNKSLYVNSTHISGMSLAVRPLCNRFTIRIF
jgi:hypothetical protein